MRVPLGHMKERQVGLDRPPAMHYDGLEAGSLTLLVFWLIDFGGRNLGHLR